MSTHLSPQMTSELTSSSSTSPLTIVNYWIGHIKHRIEGQYEYRYICPSSSQPGLKSFYGYDRSFSHGLLFDTTDFIIQFALRDWSSIKPIDHHPRSYHGSLSPSNVSIVALYVRQNAMDYEETDFIQHLKTLLSSVPHDTLIYRYQSCQDDLTGKYIIVRSLNAVHFDSW